MMLQMALRMANKYADFQFDKFFGMWEYPGIERIVGYVDFYDEKHKHYHIYDALSRHFVAIDPHVVPQVHEFVEFTPIIPEDGKFKTAVVHKAYPCPLPEGKGYYASNSSSSLPSGRAEVGAFFYDAVVTKVDDEKGFFEYRITSEIPTTPEGVMTGIGSGFMGANKLEVEQNVRLLIILRRAKDGVKRNYVAKML